MASVYRGPVHGEPLAIELHNTLYARRGERVEDHPRRAWCSPACGNRARQARHYARHHH